MKSSGFFFFPFCHEEFRWITPRLCCKLASTLRFANANLKVFAKALNWALNRLHALRPRARMANFSP
jgi:hypothetical protein